MRYLPTREQMQAADAHTIHVTGMLSMVLMERAALKSVEVMEHKNLNLSRTLIVCGSGNNGGDGFAIARLLWEKGYKITVLFAGKETSCTEECAQQMRILRQLGISIDNTCKDQEYTTIIDALFGVGLSREIEGHYSTLIKTLNDMGGAKVAIDTPSGVCAATGTVLGIAFLADITVSFCCEKLGTVLYPGKQYAGEVIPVNIGIPLSTFEQDKDVCYTLDKNDIAARLPKRIPNSHKGSYGKLLIIAGSPGMSGAAFLSAKAAYMVGCGLVQIYTAEENRMILQQQLPEAIITTYTGYDETQLHKLLDWADGAVIGPGLGKGDIARSLVRETVRYFKKPCVADADGLNILSEQKELLSQKAPVIFTPHMKEMTRLLGCEMEELLENRMERLYSFTEKTGAVCVLKDARTLVACTGKRTFVNTSGNAAMAKAGSGDVLTGVIAGLFSQGMDAYESAVLGVYIHGCAGDLARETHGNYSLLARDLTEGIKHCINEQKETDRDETI